MVKYFVFDDHSDNWSEGYDTFEEAKNDLDNDISYVWSFEAEVIKCEVK